MELRKAQLDIKKKLKEACEAHVNNRVKNVSEALRISKESANSQDKSSAGDKHETGRALMHLEQEKSAKILDEANKLKAGLNQLNVNDRVEGARFGAVVICGEVNFFISISIGKITIESTNYFAISPVSPIAKVLEGLRMGDKFNFNGKQLIIKEIF